MDPPEIPSPKRADLYQLQTCFPELTAKTPNLIFSAPIMHTHTEEDSHTYDTDSEVESKIEIKPPSYKILPMKTRKTPRVTLVLDLDETLVHSEMTPITNPDHIFKIRLNHDLYNIYVAYRPGLLAFLQTVCSAFEVVIFTASMRAYAEQVLKALDPQYRLRYKFYRESCVEVKGNYVKDLRLLGRDLAQVVIIDNSEPAFYCQPENGILIPSWFNDQNDRELEKLFPVLEGLRNSQDVREFLRSNK